MCSFIPPNISYEQTEHYTEYIQFYYILYYNITVKILYTENSSNFFGIVPVAQIWF